MQNKNRYDGQMISVDICLFSIINSKLCVLLAKRAEQPYIDNWSLVGGKVYNDESCENAVVRELKEKANITDINPILCGVFSDPKRDIRFRNISVSYLCLTNHLSYSANPKKISQIQWFEIDNIPNLAFDHNSILQNAYKQLKNKVYDIEFVRNFLPQTFTLPQLQTIYENILQTKIDKRNFRRKLNSLSCLQDTLTKNQLDTHKKSAIYKFK